MTTTTITSNREFERIGLPPDRVWSCRWYAPPTPPVSMRRCSRRARPAAHPTSCLTSVAAAPTSPLLPPVRSHAMECRGGPFKAILDVNAPVPPRGRCGARRFALGAVFVSHVTLGQCFEAGDDLRVGLKPFRRAPAEC